MNILSDYPPAAPRVVAGFLFASYLLGAPTFAALEVSSGLMSTRFGYWPAFLYLVFVVQFACGLLLLQRRRAIPVLAILTLVSLGAIASHFRIGSPLTSLPALGYTALQIWLGWRLHRDR